PRRPRHPRAPPRRPRERVTVLALGRSRRRGEGGTRELEAGAEARAAEVVGPRHHAAVFGLHLDRQEPAIGGRDRELLAARSRPEQRARRVRGPGARPGAPDREPAIAASREGARPRIAAAHQAREVWRRPAPVEVAVGLLESWRERRLLVALGRGREGVEPLERLDEDLGAEDGKARRELPRGLL